MSTTPQKQETHEMHEEQEQTSSPPTPPSVENQTQDTETGEEAMATKDEEHEHKEEKLQEEEDEKTQEEEVQSPAKASTPVAKKTLSASTSATKRKFDALHARNAAGDASISEHEKNKKARASALMKTPGTKKAPTKTRDFSFARPTASSASRTAALARDQAKATPTPPPVRKPLHPKRTPAKVPRASEPAPRTPAMTDKASRPHVSYTPYTGPLPPLTVESSFAPKGSQILDRGARTASPAKSRMAAAACKPRPASAKKAKPQGTTGKENNGVTTEGGAATNAAASIKASRTPIKSSTTGSPVSKEQNRSAFEEKAKAQLLASQQAASPVSTPAETVEPTV